MEMDAAIAVPSERDDLASADSASHADVSEALSNAGYATGVEELNEFDVDMFGALQLDTVPVTVLGKPARRASKASRVARGSSDVGADMCEVCEVEPKAMSQKLCAGCCGKKSMAMRHARRMGVQHVELLKVIIKIAGKTLNDAFAKFTQECGGFGRGARHPRSIGSSIQLSFP